MVQKKTLVFKWRSIIKVHMKARSPVDHTDTFRCWQKTTVISFQENIFRSSHKSAFNPFHTYTSITIVKAPHSLAYVHSTCVETELFRVCGMGFNLNVNPPCLMLFLGDCGMRGGPPSCPICIPIFCRLARRFFGFCCDRVTENNPLFHTG